MTFETGVGTAGVLLDAHSGSAAVAIEFAVNDVEPRLVFVKAHLEIHRLAFIFAGRNKVCEVGDTPFNVKMRCGALPLTEVKMPLPGVAVRSKSEKARMA